MQGAERADRQLLDAAALVGHLVPEGSVFAFLAEHRVRCSRRSCSRTCSRPDGAAEPAG